MLRLDQLRSIPLFVLFEVAERAWSPEALERLRTPLARPGAEELGMLVAHDLARIVPAVADAGVCFLGASFEAAELLQPGRPVHTLLGEQYRLSLAGDGFQRRLLFLGALGGALPDGRLHPDARRAPSPLRLMPLGLIADPQDLARIDTDLEESLLDAGECAPPVVTALASWFGVEIAHAGYLTLLDVLAVLRAQYEQAGLSLLAELLEQSQLSPQRPICLLDPGGLQCGWDGQQVRLCWQALDPDQPMTEAQRARLRLQRLLLQGLALHGMAVTWVACPAEPVEAMLEAPVLEGELVVEGIADEGVCRLRAHTDDDLGVLVVDGLDRDGARRCRIHPLSAAGLQRIGVLLPHASIESVALRRNDS